MFKNFLKKPTGIFYAAIFVLIGLSILGQVFLKPARQGYLKPDPNKTYHRIVSFLPSITEILFALDLGDQVVGVTRYCKFPPEAQKKTQIGGVLDVSYETVYSLEPDLLIVANNSEDVVDKLRKMNIPILEIEDRDVAGILRSIKEIGSILHREKKAEQVIGEIQHTIDKIASRTKGLSKPLVLITFLRPLGEGKVRDVYIAGDHSYFNELLKYAGGQNVYQGTKLITSPIVSAEGVLQMDPDIIIEVVNEFNVPKFSDEDILKDWETLPELRAYKERKIFVVTQNFIDIPGPRVSKSLEVLARIIQPGVDWDKP